MSQLTERCKHNIDAIVLAGGQAKRMQGRDKGLVPFRGKPLIEHVLARISPQVDRIVISANRNQVDYRHFGFEVVSDRRPDFQGPLAGIEACAAFCTAEFTLITACDTPLLPSDLTQRLLLTLADQSCEASYADDGDRQHYLCALVRTAALASVSDYLDRKQRSVHGWLSLLNAKASYFADCTEAFHNLNRDADT